MISSSLSTNETGGIGHLDPNDRLPFLLHTVHVSKKGGMSRATTRRTHGRRTGRDQSALARSFRYHTCYLGLTLEIVEVDVGRSCRSRK